MAYDALAFELDGACMACWLWYATAALWAARDGRECSCDRGERGYCCWLRPDDFLCCTGGRPGCLAGDARADGDAPFDGGVSFAGDSAGERRELISMVAAQ